MPRYHFNIYDGVRSPDLDGTELPDIHAARREGVMRAGAMIEDVGKRNQSGDDWRMEVTDDTGLLLFRMDFVVVESSAVR